MAGDECGFVRVHHWLSVPCCLGLVPLKLLLELVAMANVWLVAVAVRVVVSVTAALSSGLVAIDQQLRSPWLPSEDRPLHEDHEVPILVLSDFLLLLPLPVQRLV